MVLLQPASIDYRMHFTFRPNVGCVVCECVMCPRPQSLSTQKCFWNDKQSKMNVCYNQAFSHMFKSIEKTNITNNYC